MRLQYAFPVKRIVLAIPLVLLTLAASAQAPSWTAQEKPIAEKIAKLRSLPDDVRATATRDLALEIRGLGSAPARLRLAMGLASRATEGDFGRDTLQEVTTTLESAIKEHPPSGQGPYLELASLARYEHMQVSMDSPQFTAAMQKLEDEDRQRNEVNFTLTDLNGKSWTLKDLKGKVVMLNFWATWCPPCRKEMPDLESLYRQFESQGFVILGISDDDPDKVRAFVQKQGTTYPVLLDAGSKVTHALNVSGIPKTFIYAREGTIAAQSIDMRTRKQFLEMLAGAGLR
jgi:peroxiredoxin